MIVIGDTLRAKVCQLAAGPIRKRDIVQKVLGNGADSASRNLVVRKRLLANRVDQCFGDCGKISRAFGGGWNECHVAGCGCTYARALVGSEEEQFVFQDRSAGADAELISLEGILRGREKVPRVQIPVAQEFKR